MHQNVSTITKLLILNIFVAVAVYVIIEIHEVTEHSYHTWDTGRLVSVLLIDTSVVTFCGLAQNCFIARDSNDDVWRRIASRLLLFFSVIDLMCTIRVLWPLTLVRSSVLLYDFFFYYTNTFGILIWASLISLVTRDGKRALPSKLTPLVAILSAQVLID